MRTADRRLFGFVVAACAVLIAGVIFVSVGIGSHRQEFSILDAWRAWWRAEISSPAYAIGIRLRLARTLLALEAGTTLALCGVVFQTLFRNSLATPYTLGIASGGSLGALIAIRAGFEVSILGLSSISLSAFLGALIVVGVVLILAHGPRPLTTEEVLLAGVTMGLFSSAMMMFVTYLSNARETFEIIRWMMGSLDTVGNFGSTTSLPLIVPGWIVLLASARALNQYSLGDELAQARGVNVVRLQIVCVLFASLATAAVVAVCGPIGFVGLVVPQMVARLLGRDCRILLPASAMLGGVFLAVCDWLSQLVLPIAGRMTGRDLGGAVLPIGVVTAVVGVPIFLFLLNRRRREP